MKILKSFECCDLYSSSKLSIKCIESNRVHIDVTKNMRVRSSTGSKGNQRKWVKDNKLIKLNCLGYEDIAEICTCWLLSKLHNRNLDFVKYYPCNIYEDNIYTGCGVFSYNFVMDYEEISFKQILQDTMTSFSISYNDIIDLFDKLFNINIGPYLDYKACVDAITRNEDSHWGNFILLRKYNKYKAGPIFDYGDACMSDCISYPIDCDFEVAFNSLQAKPFKTNFEDQINPYCNRLQLSYDEFINSIDLSDSDKMFCRAIKTILYGLERSKNIAWEDIK